MEPKQPETGVIADYLQRTGFEGPIGADLATLTGMHVAHLSRIPFENLDVRLGRPVGLDRASLLAKLVRRRRGGYCFEQNGLFAIVLGELGFPVATLEARVRPAGATQLLPRTHMVLRVEAGGRPFLADVGFGADGPLEPVPFDGTPSEQPDGTYRVDRESEAVRVLRRRWRGAWSDLYAFTLVPALPVDFEVAHHYTSTHPSSPFVRTLTVQRSESGLRRILRGTTYTERRGVSEATRELAIDEVPSVVRDAFELDVGDEEVRAALDPEAP